jgi:hypothetical protein
MRCLNETVLANAGFTFRNLSSPNALSLASDLERYGLNCVARSVPAELTPGELTPGELEQIGKFAMASVVQIQTEKNGDEEPSRCAVFGAGTRLVISWLSARGRSPAREPG